jgi:uncharacterized protein (DUF1330 family)
LVLEKMAQYSAALPAIYEKYGGKYLGLGGPSRGVECLHGSWADRSVVLAEFASFDSVKGFWYSEEYEEAKKIRTGAGVFDVCAYSGNSMQAGSMNSVFGIHLHKGEQDLLTSHRSAGLNFPQAELLVCADSSPSKVLEGSLDNYKVDIFSFENRAAAVTSFETPIAKDEDSNVFRGASSQVLLLNANGAI